MDVSDQQASGSTLDLWDAKVLSISEDEPNTILYGKASALPPMTSAISTPTLQPSSGAGHGASTDISTLAVTQDLGLPNDAQQPSVQPTNSRDTSIPQGENGNITSPPYMKMIAKSIMASPMHRLVLSQIYSYIKQNYPTHVASKESWRNSVRHNLSTNKCFQRCGRAPNGRGFVWQIHPACMPMFQCGNFTRRDALSEVYRYERQNRASVERQQTENLGVSMRQQNIPYYQPQNCVVTTDMLPGRMPQQFHHQMEDSHLYVLAPGVQQNIFSGTMPQVSQPSNAQCQYMNNQGKNISAQASFFQQNIFNGPMPQVGQPRNAQCQYMNNQGEKISAQASFCQQNILNGPMPQVGQPSNAQCQYMNNQGENISAQASFCQQNIFNGPMPQVGQLYSNAQCQYMNNQGQNISAQASLSRQNNFNGPMPQVSQPSNAQGQCGNNQGQNVSAQCQYSILSEQYTNAQSQFTSSQGQYMDTEYHYTSIQGQYVNTPSEHTNTQCHQ